MPVVRIIRLGPCGVPSAWIDPDVDWLMELEANPNAPRGVLCPECADTPLEPCATLDGQVQHLSNTLRLNPVGQGRVGKAICHWHGDRRQASGAVMDQDELDGYHSRSNPSRKHRLIAELPLCEWCGQIAGIGEVKA